jgi:hypothetical protein
MILKSFYLGFRRRAAPAVWTFALALLAAGCGDSGKGGYYKKFVYPQNKDLAYETVQCSNKACMPMMRNLFDGNCSPGSYWEEGGAPNFSVVVKNQSPERLMKYAIACGELANRMPVEWTVYGSNDGSDWKVLDTRKMKSGWMTFQEKTFYPAKTDEFRCFKFEFTKTVVNAPIIRLYELTLLYKN